jgi:hypothetical protein
MDYSAALPKIVEKETGQNFYRYPTNYPEFQVFRYFGTATWNVNLKYPALGFVCNGVIHARGEQAKSGESILITENLDIESFDGEVFFCCGNSDR